MIADKIENFSLYFKEEKFKKAFSYITGNVLKNMPAGKYEIMGDEVFALISDYNSKSPDSGKLEGHKKYIDLQYIISGNELIGYAPIGSQEICSPYDAEKDFHLFTGDCSFINMQEGMFVVFYPHDLHMPGIQNKVSAAVKKLVIKIAV